MEEINVNFSFNGVEMIIQCSQANKMIEIYQKYAKKLGESFNSLSFFYNQNQLNFELGIKEQALPSDVSKKEIKVIVYKNENNIKRYDKKIKLKEIIY